MRLARIFVLWLIAMPTASAEEDVDSPASRAIVDGKVSVGRAVFETDPQRRRQSFEEASRHFSLVLDHGLVATKDERDEARDYLRQLQQEIDANRLADRAHSIRVLVVTCNLDGSITRRNDEKYRALAYKVKDRKDPELARRVYEKSLETVRIRTTWTAEDRNHLRAALERAAALVFRWSRGRVRPEFKVESLTTRIDDLRRQRRSRGMWLLGDPPDDRKKTKQDAPPEVLKAIEKFGPGKYDFVLLAPKYEKGDDSLRQPGWAAEAATAFAPIDGRVRVGHLSLEAHGDGRKADGKTEEPPFDLVVVDRLYALMREAIAVDAGGYPSGERFVPSRVQGLADWIPPFDRTLKRGFREYPRGEALYEEVLGAYFTEGMFEASSRLTRAFREAARLRPTDLGRPMADGDPSTGMKLRRGRTLDLELRSATSARALGILLGVAPGKGDPVPLAVRIETPEGPKRYTLEAPLRPGPHRLALPDSLKIRALSIEFMDEVESPDSVEVREILFW